MPTPLRKPRPVSLHRIQRPTINRIVVLAVLLARRRDDLCAKDVAEILETDRSCIYPILHGLADRGWVSRVEYQPGQAERSRVYFRLTTLGKAYAERFCPAITDPVAAFAMLRFSYDEPAPKPYRPTSGGRDGGRRSSGSLRAHAS